MTQYLRPGKRLVDHPVRWLIPPWSMSYPKSGTSVQHEVFVGDSKQALNVRTLKWEGGRWTVQQQVLWPCGQMSSLSGRTTKRFPGKVFHPVEVVVLMKLWDRAGGEVFVESRYEAAEEKLLTW